MKLCMSTSNVGLARGESTTIAESEDDESYCSLHKGIQYWQEHGTCPLQVTWCLHGCMTHAPTYLHNSSPVSTAQSSRPIMQPLRGIPGNQGLCCPGRLQKIYLPPGDSEEVFILAKCIPHCGITVFSSRGLTTCPLLSKTENHLRIVPESTALSEIRQNRNLGSSSHCVPLNPMERIWGCC